MKTGMMKITASVDRCGWLTVRPVSQRRERAYSAHLSTFGIDDASVFIQSEHDVDAFIAHDVPSRYKKDLREGWTVTFHVDPWVFGHWLGYDCHEIA